MRLPGRRSMHRSRILRSHVLTISEAAVRDRTVEAMARMAPVQVPIVVVIQAPTAVEAPMAEGIAQATMAVPMEAAEGVALAPMPAPTEAAEGMALAPTVALTAAEGTARDRTVEAVLTVQGLTVEAGVTARVRAVVIAAV